MVPRTMSAERRSHPRTPVRILVQHHTGADSHHEVDYATDLSPCGIFIRTTKQLIPNTTIHVRFSPQRDSHMVEAFCRVARVTADGVGAVFLQLDAEATALLKTALAA
jgi:hypothetical protein